MSTLQVLSHRCAADPEAGAELSTGTLWFPSGARLRLLLITALESCPGCNRQGQQISHQVALLLNPGPRGLILPGPKEEGPCIPPRTWPGQGQKGCPRPKGIIYPARKSRHTCAQFTTPHAMAVWPWADDFTSLILFLISTKRHSVQLVGMLRGLNEVRCLPSVPQTGRSGSHSSLLATVIKDLSQGPGTCVLAPNLL